MSKLSRIRKISIIGSVSVLVAILSLSCEKTILGPETKQVPAALQDSRFATVLDSLRYALDLPALAAAIVTDTGVVEARALGCRRYGGPANVQDNDQFHLGSCGKAFTAVLLATFVDEGRIGWDSTLASIFPEYGTSMRNEYKIVTLRMLLSHSAGFTREPDVTLTSNTIIGQRKEVVAWALSQPQVVPTGTYWYSNVGYIIAGAIAEKLTGRSYEELIVERVITPLGITSAGFGTAGTPGKEDQPLEHTANHAPIEPSFYADNPPIYLPAGNIHMSVRDWAKFIRWVLLAENGNQTLLRRQTARVLTTAVVRIDAPTQYAMGWVVEDITWLGGKVLFHGGSNTYNSAEAYAMPNMRFGVILVTNQGGTSYGGHPLNPAVSRLIDFHLKGD